MMTVDSDLRPSDGQSRSEKDAKALQFIEEMTRNADSVQQQVLREILSRNSETEYLRRFDLKGSTDRKTFKSKIPVVRYEDVQPDIQRIVNGDRSPILCAHPVSEFLTSSGTSGGERKLMPTIDEDLDRRELLYSLRMPVINQYVADMDKGKALLFLFVKSETNTPSGLPARPVLTSYYKSDRFKNRPNDPYNVYTSPNEAILCTDTFQSMYTQMLCGLLMRHDVLRIGAVFAAGLLRAIRFLQTNWKDLTHDISTGTLNPQITDSTIRNCISKILTNPEFKLAEFITICCQGNWEGVITKIWSNAKYLDVIVTGTMAQYVPTLDYYSNGLPIVSTTYGSSESYFGINLKPICKPSEVSYTIMPNMAYFEFLVVDGAHAGELVELADVDIGKEYELVITTYSGLYRYKVGDILCVTGFYNAAPEFKFVRRKNVVLSIESDKTDESELQNAVENAAALLKEVGASVVEYTSYADTKTVPGHYVMYWEIFGKDENTLMDDEIMSRCCHEMEEWLNEVYRQSRVEDGSIGPLEIRVVKNGTFEMLMDYAISRGASINQYKVSRCVSFTPILEILDSKVVSSHFSHAPPRWSPASASNI